MRAILSAKRFLSAHNAIALAPFGAWVVAKLHTWLIKIHSFCFFKPFRVKIGYSTARY